MSFSNDSQFYEAFVPVYDVIPERWDDARPMLVEQIKKISNAVNVREIGWLLDEEYLSGQQFIPGSETPPQFRSVLRKTIDCSPLVIGANNFPHGITIDNRFTLIQAYGAGTNSGTLVSEPIPNGSDTLSLTATNVVITVGAAYDRAYAVITYIQEL